LSAAYIASVNTEIQILAL